MLSLRTNRVPGIVFGRCRPLVAVVFNVPRTKESVGCAPNFHKLYLQAGQLAPRFEKTR